MDQGIVIDQATDFSQIDADISPIFFTDFCLRAFCPHVCSMAQPVQAHRRPGNDLLSTD
jgi:hypothetical protein